MRKLIPIVTLCYLLFACSSPIEKAYNKASLADDMLEVKAKLADEDFETLTGYIALKEIADDNMLGKTYSDLLVEAKELQESLKKQQEEADRLAEEARIEEAKRIEKLNNALTVTIFKKGFSEYDYDEYITMTFAFQNKTDKAIRAFTGVMVFNDLFDKEIKKLNLTYDDGVPASGRKNWPAQMDYNQFRDEDTSLKNKDLADIKLVWKPEKIIFTDGSTLE